MPIPSLLKSMNWPKFNIRPCGNTLGLQDLDPPVQPEKAFIHVLSHSFDLKLFIENLRTNAELFMSFVNWPREKWELEDPQLRTWPTTMSRRPGCPRYLPLHYVLGSRGDQLLVSATPAGFLFTQQRLQVALQPLWQSEPVPASDIPQREELLFHFSRTSCKTYNIYPNNTFLGDRGIFSTGKSVINLVQGRWKGTRNKCPFSAWQSCVSARITSPSHRHASLDPALLICSSLSGQCSSACLGGVCLLLKRTGIATAQDLPFKSLLPQADILESLK